jgi:hypothetical protein
MHEYGYASYKIALTRVRFPSAVVVTRTPDLAVASEHWCLLLPLICCCVGAELSRC